MKTDNVDYLPVWKKNSTAEEWLLELAAIARKHPERFNKAIIVFEETLPNGNTKTDYHCRSMTTNEAIGILEYGKIRLIESSTR